MYTGMHIPLQHLWLIPFIAGTSWLLTLSTIFIIWIAKNRPRYPSQVNPYVAFISDIAAFELKPIFIIGGILTAVFYTGTIISVHFARYSPKIYDFHSTKITKAVSILAVAASVVAGLSLISLSILDTYRHNEPHSILLRMCFVGLAISASCTSFVYFDETRKGFPKHGVPYQKLRVSSVGNAGIVLIEMCLGAAFLVFLGKGLWRVAGILEWIVSFLGAFWLYTFIGYVATPKEEIEIREREPLLRGTTILE